MSDHVYKKVELTGTSPKGIEDAIAAIERELPRPDVAFKALLPYERGDLLNRIHTNGEVEELEHTGEGTRVRGRANADLAGELAPYAVTRA